ncbi:MAG: ABC transporter substrate-binding protein [Bradyrhizobium sp.]|nr:ABC transporter substrate-binding protein [Bradyrhizobium sp.]
MKRREFVRLIGAAAAAILPLKVRAQGSMPLIGFLRVTSEADSAHLVNSFRDGLKELGFVEGQNVGIDFRFAEGHRDRLPHLAADLISKQPAAIMTDQAARSLKATTSTIPIIFALGADPVADGLVTSLNLPGGNVTGIVFFSSQLGAKRVDLLRQMVPTATTMGVLAYPASPEDRTERSQIEAAAKGASLQLAIAEAANESDIENAFASFAEQQVAAVLVGSGPFFRSHKERILGLAARYKLPASYSLREYAEAGGLMSYGTSITEAYRQGGIYAARILKGEKIGNLPVMQSTKFDLVVNLKTAKTLGLTVPESLLVAADEVIE